MAKNFNLKIKNSQLAAMLKQKGSKADKSTPEKKLDGGKKNKVLAKDKEPASSEIKKKVYRKAKQAPTAFVNDPVDESIDKSELLEDKEPKHLSTDQIKEESVKESREELHIKKDYPNAPIKKDDIPVKKFHERKNLKPIEERNILPQNKYQHPSKEKKNINNKNQETSSFKKKETKNDKPTTATKEKFSNTNSSVKSTTPSKDKKIDDKKKKGMESYKRQAFSRVFDQRSLMTSEESWRRRRNKKTKKVVDPENIIRPKNISIKLPISVKELASELKVKGSQVLQKLFLEGLTVTINEILDDETTIQLIGNEFQCEIEIDTKLEDRLQITDKSLKEEIKEIKPKLLQARPPVVTVMGHVDHGKTSIIDSFRKSNIASGEAGSITQHIGAFICNTTHGEFCIIDTPGHEAFTAIRSRGTSITDIIVLVIAGDEGIKPQTVEAIDKAKEAKIPILVAINKMDKPGFNADNIYKQLADHDLLPEAWGGEVITVNCSASTGEGISQLAEMIALQTDILELKANPNMRARGTVIESELHKGLGVTATLLVQNGTLKAGDAVVFEHEWGKTKTIQNEYNQTLDNATPSTPVKVTGLSGVPPAGNEFIVVNSEKEAKQIALKRQSVHRHTQLKKAKGISAQSILDKKVENQTKKTLNVILKADVGGSLEALKDTLLKIPTDKVIINIIHSDVGQVSESDINLADASKAIILGFHTRIEPHAESLIKQKKVKILLSSIIYHMIDDVKVEMQKLLDKIRHEEHMSTAKVLEIFKSSRLGNIAGSIIIMGTMKRNYLVKLRRNGEIIHEGPLASLKRLQDDVKEVKKDIECGILISGYQDFKVDDEIEGYEISYLEQEL